MSDDAEPATDPDDEKALLEDLAWAVREDPLRGEHPTRVDVETAVPGAIGRFRITGKLGEGGMGIVYEAEQDTPSRTVALKVMRPLLAGDAAVQRFRLEAEVLARLEHPGIARIFEVGTLDVGGGSQPFFAMELVRGRPLDEHARAFDLGVRARLEVVIELCDAVEHAHHMGVVHRDLKPANILVDDSGRARVLDFGVARSTRGDPRATLDRTAAGQLIGTLPYMSPEQVSGDPDRIDHRSDVYALGVILFELLAGRLPKDVGGRPVANAVRTIAETDAPRLGGVESRYRGDLEVIVGKALERDRDRRYVSASALADDLRRHLDHLPIAARPPSTVYRVTKFMRRNRVLVAGVVVAFLLLIGGIVTTSIQAERAREAERAASANLDDARDEARTERAVREFLVAVFERGDPEQHTTSDPTLVDVIEDAARRVQGDDLAEFPEARGDVHRAVGSAFRGLGRFDDAKNHLEAALLCYEGLKRGPRKRVHALNALARLAMDRRDWKESERVLNEAFALRGHLLPRDAMARVETVGSLAGTLMQLQRLDEARPMLERVVEEWSEILGPECADVGVALGNLATLHRRQGRLDEAERTYLRALAIQRKELGPENPHVATTLGNLAKVYEARREFDRALATMEEALALKEKTLGDDHPELVVLVFNIGMTRWAVHKRERAIEELTRARTLAKKHLGRTHGTTVHIVCFLAQMRSKAGDVPAAKKLLSELLIAVEAEHGKDHASAKRLRKQLLGLGS